MIDAPVLGASQIGDFHDAGYVIVRGAFDAAQMGCIEAWARELAERPEESGRHWVFHEKSLIDPGAEPLICRIENIS